MREQLIRFGDFIKRKRQDNPRKLTLKDMSERLGISLSFLSDVENNRRKPFDKDKIKVFAEVLNLSDEDIAKMYDLAARDRKEVPSDIEDIMMYSEIGDMARHALRQSKAGAIDEEDWKTFIRDMEKKGDGEEMTRYEWVKNMSIEEMADKIVRLNFIDEYCKNDCEAAQDWDCEEGCCLPENEMKCCIKWLKEEVKC